MVGDMMKKCFLFLMLPITMGVYAQDYQLVWSDEFDNNTIGTNWMVWSGYPSNNELQYYTSSGNAEVKDGCLVLTARRQNSGSRKFTSGRVVSIQMVEFTHGLIEARIKMPKTAQGLWPAFWMMGNDALTKSWPYCGETDIVEVGSKTGFGGKEETYISSAIHYGESVSQHTQDVRGYFAPYSIQDDFHIFGCKWTADSMAFYLDRNPKPYFRVYIGSKITKSKFFHKPNFMLLNVAVGGDYTGIYDASNITALPDAGSEGKMYIDWVRIYQKEESITFGENDKDQVDDPTFPPSYQVTGIVHPATSISSDEQWFMVDGRRLSGCPVNNGLYVCKGKKFIK